MPMKQLLSIVKQLRHPTEGCPWDIKQTPQTLIPYVLEEAYEVVEAIEKNDGDNLKKELGDLLLQVALHAQIAEEASNFNFSDITDAICSKMIERHPHVFGDNDSIKTEEDQIQSWETIKEAERAKNDTQVSDLDGVSLALPALTRAYKLQKRAARKGFDWKNIIPVFDKVYEEIAEFEEAVKQGDPTHIEDEVGDILFAVVNLARHVKMDPETALRKASRKFERRYQQIEKNAALQNKKIDELSLEELDTLWQRAKKDLESY
jgi:nucleoside triphosphate diphosphatase